MYGLTLDQAALWADRGLERFQGEATFQANAMREVFIDILCGAGVIKRN